MVTARMSGEPLTHEQLMTLFEAACWENLALQGNFDGLVVHGMEGFSYDRAKIELAIPDGYTVEAMIAIGKPGDKNNLPADVQKGEKPSDRRPLEEIVAEGSFTNLGEK